MLLCVLLAGFLMGGVVNAHALAAVCVMDAVAHGFFVFQDGLAHAFLSMSISILVLQFGYLAGILATGIIGYETHTIPTPRI